MPVLRSPFSALPAPSPCPTPPCPARVLSCRAEMWGCGRVGIWYGSTNQMLLLETSPFLPSTSSSSSLHPLSPPSLHHTHQPAPLPPASVTLSLPLQCPPRPASDTACTCCLQSQPALYPPNPLLIIVFGSSRVVSLPCRQRCAQALHSLQQWGPWHRDGGRRCPSCQKGPPKAPPVLSPGSPGRVPINVTSPSRDVCSQPRPSRHGCHVGWHTPSFQLG